MGWDGTRSHSPVFTSGVRVTGTRQRRTPYGVGARLGRATTLPLLCSCPVGPCRPGQDANGIRPCSAFCSLEVACAMPITSACSRIGGVFPAVVVVVVVVVAAASRESSHCTPLAFVTRHLSSLRRPTPPGAYLDPPAPQIPARIANARSLARVHFWTSLSSMTTPYSFPLVILPPPFASPRGSLSFKSDRGDTLCARSARGL